MCSYYLHNSNNSVLCLTSGLIWSDLILRSALIVVLRTLHAGRFQLHGCHSCSTRWRTWFTAVHTAGASSACTAPRANRCSKHKHELLYKRCLAALCSTIVENRIENCELEIENTITFDVGALSTLVHYSLSTHLDSTRENWRKL